METLFMEPIDTQAARAHAHLVAHGVRGLSEARRIAWGRFIMSLWFRTPEDVGHLWRAISTLAGAEAGKAVLNIEVPAELPAVAVHQLQMETLRQAIDHKERGDTLVNMEWEVLDVTSTRELWISDWPIDLPSSVPWLGNASSYVTVPIAPNKLFVAAGSARLLRAISSLPRRELILRQNRATVCRALNFVGTTNDKASQFIFANFGTLPRPSIIKTVADGYQGVLAASTSI